MRTSIAGSQFLKKVRYINWVDCKILITCYSEIIVEPTIEEPPKDVNNAIAEPTTEPAGITKKERGEFSDSEEDLSEDEEEEEGEEKKEKVTFRKSATKYDDYSDNENDFSDSEWDDGAKKEKKVPTPQDALASALTSKFKNDGNFPRTTHYNIKKSFDSFFFLQAKFLPLQFLKVKKMKEIYL